MTKTTQRGRCTQRLRLYYQLPDKNSYDVSWDFQNFCNISELFLILGFLVKQTSNNVGKHFTDVMNEKNFH